jgi:hypothetical protein
MVDGQYLKTLRMDSTGMFLPNQKEMSIRNQET